MAGQFGDKDPITFVIGPLDATSVAVDRDYFIVPSNAAVGYKAYIQYTKSVASTSGTLKIRAISDTSAPGASASSTVVELLATPLDLSATVAVNTVTTASTAGVVIKPGSRIATLDGGTLTGLVGLIVTVTLVPVNNEI